jgi:hypothetical protein
MDFVPLEVIAHIMRQLDCHSDRVAFLVTSKRVCSQKYPNRQKNITRAKP